MYISNYNIIFTYNFLQKKKVLKSYKMMKLDF